MHDKGAVRVLHGLADHTEETQTSFKRQALGGTPVRDRDAIHELHDEVGRSVGRESPIDETGDVGINQSGQHLSLGAKTLDGVRVARARTHKLDCDFLSILAIGSLGPVHGAHAAVPEHAQKTPWPKTVADQRIGARSAELPINDESFNRKRAVVSSRRKHRFELVAQFRILAT